MNEFERRAINRGARQGRRESKRQSALAFLQAGVCAEVMHHATGLRPEQLQASVWKSAIEFYLKDFLSLCFPTTHDQIDWARPHRFFDSELRKLIRNNAQGNKRSDLLVQVSLKSGGEQMLLIHVDVRKLWRGILTSRMVGYNARVSQTFGQSVASLVLSHDLQVYGSTFSNFSIFKLKDQTSWPKKPDNAFSWLIAAHNQARTDEGQPGLRKTHKVYLAKLLLCSDQPEDAVLDLLRLLDWLLPLPESLEQRYKEELAKFQADRRLSSPQQSLVSATC